MFRNLTIDPTVEFIDGKITESSVDNLIESVQDVATEYDSEFGTDVGTFISSVLPVLGNSRPDIIPHVNYGVLVNGCSEVFVTNGNRYELSMVPSSPQSLIFSLGGLMYVPTNSFLNANEYTVIGRTIVFSALPSTSSFSISYDGYVPEDYGASINHQTLYPNPVNILEGKNTKPQVTEIDPVNFIYSLSVDNETYIAGIDEEFLNGVPNSIPQNLSSYIDSNAVKNAPLDYCSVWKLNTVTGKYEKVDIVTFKIVSANTFIFTAKERMSTTATYVVSLYSKSILGLVEELYHAYKNHTHDGYGNTKKVSHQTIDSDPEIDYHTQYLRKTGYSSSEKNNLMIGDMFIGSLDSSSDSSNTITRSAMMVFGDYAFGHAIYRGSGELGYLIIDGRSSNGINIILETPSEGTDGKTFLKSGESKLWNKLEIGKTKTSLSVYGGDKLYLTADNEVLISKLDATLIRILDNSAINFNGVLFSSGPTGMEITTEVGKEMKVNGNVNFESGNFSGASVDLLTIKEDKKILFLPTNEELVSKASGPTFSFRANFSEFGSIGLFSEDNSSPLKISNMMKLESKNEIYMTHPIAPVALIDDVTYSFKQTVTDAIRIDKIKDWPKQNFNAGKATLGEIALLDSTFSDKKGITIGASSKIYSSGNDSVCSLSSLVLESRDDVLFLRLGDSSTNCDNKSFAKIRTGQILVTGGIDASDDISSLSNISANNLFASESISSEGDIVSGKKIVAVGIKSTGGLVVTGETSIQDVIVSGSMTISNVEVKNNGAFGGDVSVGKSISITGSLTTGKAAAFGGSITTDSDISGARLIASLARIENLQVGSDAIVSGFLQSSKLDVGGDITAGGNITSETSTPRQSLTTKSVNANDISTTRLVVQGGTVLQDLTVSGSIAAGSSVNIEGRLTVNGRNVANGGMQVLQGLSVSEGLNVSGGINASGNISISGNTTMSGSLIFAQGVSNGNMVVKGSLSVPDGLLSAKSLEVTSRATFSTIDIGSMFFNETITGNDVSKITTAELLVSNLVIAPRGGSTTDKMTSYVDIEALSNLTVANILEGNLVRAKSVFTLGAESSADAVYLTTEGLYFAKENSVIGSHIMTCDRLIGRVSIDYSELARFQANSPLATGLVSAINQSKFTVADNLSVEGILNVPKSLICSGTIFFNKMLPLDPTFGYVDLVAGATVYE